MFPSDGNCFHLPFLSGPDVLSVGAEEQPVQLRKAEEIQKRSAERLLEQRRVSRQRERGVRLVFALKARELQEQMSELQKANEHKDGEFL